METLVAFRRFLDVFTAIFEERYAISGTEIVANANFLLRDIRCADQTGIEGVFRERARVAFRPGPGSDGRGKSNESGTVCKKGVITGFKSSFFFAISQ